MALYNNMLYYLTHTYITYIDSLTPLSWLYMYS